LLCAPTWQSGGTLGRINKRSKAALEAAADLLATTKNQNIKAQLIKVILDYELHQQKRTEASKAERRKRAEHKELAGLRGNVQELTNKLSSAQTSKEEKISHLRSKLRTADQSLADLRRQVVNAKQEAEKAYGDRSEMQVRLNLANGIIERFAPALASEKRNECAADLFQKLKLEAPDLLAQLFKSMGLDLKPWKSWDSHYGEDSELMVKAFEQSGGEDPGKLSLLRSKLMAVGVAVDAIDAVRDYRDLKIDFGELQKRTRPQISFSQYDGSGRVINNGIPARLRPPLTEDALRIATDKLKDNPSRKLEWLEVIEKLAEPDYGMGSLVMKEIVSTRQAIDAAQTKKRV
jgi:hypothetical protein